MPILSFTLDKKPTHYEHNLMKKESHKYTDLFKKVNSSSKLLLQIFKVVLVLTMKSEEKL
jgi:hypothetical protein